MELFYIGLSLLSNAERSPAHILHSEGRRILNELDGLSAPAEHPTKFPAKEVKIAEGGRPFFADGHADFSISHSASAAAVSWLSSTQGKFCTGCDLQYMRSLKSINEIAEACFSVQEHEYILDHPIEKMKRFYQIWVLKEAWLKFKGLSVFKMQQAPSFAVEKALNFASIGNDAGSSSSPLFFLYELESSYMLAAAFETQGKITAPLVRWFSQDSLPLKSLAAVKAVVNPAKTVRPKM
jgi:phosphopantetheinyl transferase